MHKTKVSQAVRALEERQWLKRRESYEDRRDEILSLTALGRKAYLDIAWRALAFENRIINELGSEADTFLAALVKLELISNVRRPLARRRSNPSAQSTFT
jgi:DNA-binding MarR family transcriptional regulator